MLSAVTIRPATDADLPALQRLAERDSRPLPAGALFVAERDGVIDAALSLETGVSIADPFKPTAALIELLRTHVAARAERPRHATRARRLTPGLVGGSA